MAYMKNLFLGGPPLHLDNILSVLSLTLPLIPRHTPLIGCAYVGGKVYAILLAFITPVLDNKFGFNVKYTSLYLLGVSAGYITCFFIQ